MTTSSHEDRDFRIPPPSTLLDSHDLDALRGIGLRPPFDARLATLSATECLHRVAEVHRDAVLLHDGKTLRRARLRAALRTRLDDEDDEVAVGDWVVAECNAFGEWWVDDRLPPCSQIARRRHDGRDKAERTVVAANVDTVLLVMGLDLDFNLRRLERYLVLARLSGALPVVVLTKRDLCADPGDRLRDAVALLPPGAAVLALDALRDDVPGALAPWLAPGATLAMVGSSGAGKSTLTNALLRDHVQPTGGTRRGDGRGRHTTTSRSLHRTPEGACVVDTPGLRTLRLDGDDDAIAGGFDDIAALAKRCRFRDCRHQDEPGCAVRGAIDDARVRNFHKLQRDARRDAMSALERRAEVGQWKIRARAARARLAQKKSA
jgi:ribosome biogenesis GTPase